MTWTLERWQIAFHRSIITFLFIATIGLVTNFLICLISMVLLCIKRKSREVPNFAFWQLGFALTNEVMFGIQTMIMVFTQDKIEFTDLWF